MKCRIVRSSTKSGIFLPKLELFPPFRSSSRRVTITSSYVFAIASVFTVRVQNFESQCTLLYGAGLYLLTCDGECLAYTVDSLYYGESVERA